MRCWNKIIKKIQFDNITLLLDDRGLYISIHLLQERQNEQLASHEEVMLKRLLKQREILSEQNPYQVFRNLRESAGIDAETAATLCNVYAPVTLKGKDMAPGDGCVTEYVQELSRWFLWNSHSTESFDGLQETELMLASLANVLDVVQRKYPTSETDYGDWLEVLGFIQTLALRFKTQVLQMQTMHSNSIEILTVQKGPSTVEKAVVDILT